MLEFFKRNRPRLLFGILFMGALLVYSSSLRHKHHTTLFEAIVLQLTSPVYQGLERARHETSVLWQNYINLVNVRSENISLRQQVLEQRHKLIELQEIAQENIRLKKLLKFHSNTKMITIPARVIAEDASNWFQTVTINRGTYDGVHEGMPVVVAEGVVGRTIKCAGSSSRVLLSIDAASEISCLIQHNRTRGIARGMGTTIALDYALRDNDVSIGDMVVTSGTGGIFPKGLPLGRITRISKHQYGLFQSLSITPSVDFARLEDLLVIVTEQQ